MEYTPLEVAVALSLYAYNVSVHERATLVYEHFDGDCMEMVELTTIIARSPAYIATELPQPSARVYVQHALDRYGEEAKARVAANG